METTHSHTSIIKKSGHNASLSRLALVTLITITPLFCNAQLDTLDLQRLEPTYYYWDSCWPGYHALHTEYSRTMTNSQHKPFTFVHTCDMVGAGLCPEWQKVEYARYFQSDSALTILGVAAPCTFGCIGCCSSLEIADSDLTHREPEYFILYDFNPKTGDMTPVDSVRNDTAANPKYKMMVSFYIDGIYPDPEPHVAVGDTIIRYASVREAYFKEPITMQGEFYLGATQNNNYRVIVGYDSIYVPPAGAYWYTPLYRAARPFTKYVSLWLNQREELIPKGPRKVRAHLLDECNDHYFYLDTINWHTEYSKGYDLAYFLIFDTSSYVPPAVTGDTCPAPVALRMMNRIGDTVTFIWNGPDSVMFELSVERADSPGIEVASKTVPTHFATLSGFDTATWYTVRVRTLCDSSRHSDWSDSTMLYIPAQPNEPTGDSLSVVTEIGKSLEEQYTLLLPNPASFMVNIISSYYVISVTIYTMDGKEVYHAKVGAIGTDINVASFPRGTYIVRVTTSRGHVFKKLILR